MSLRIAVWIPAGLALVAVAPGGCRRPAAQAEREVGPGVMVLRMPSALGKMRRPPVEFDHDRHTAKDGCKTCHFVDRVGSLSPKFLRVNDGQSASKLMDHYHDQCQGCHKRRGEGARGCGECHAKRPRTRSTRLAMAFDYRLHYRHVRELGGKKSCESCHHFFDKTQQKLIYEKGTESNCRDCHGARDKGRALSLRNAVHRDCVSCHLKRTAAKQKSGPVLCVGCHDAKHRAEIRKHAQELTVPRLELAYSPRVKRRQPNKTWLYAPGAKAKVVAFDHRAHEPRVPFCSSCHHATLAACKSCHTQQGAKKGGGVTLVTAYHDKTAQQSCVGCHRAETGKKGCAGCHRVASAEPSKRACGVCHNGPLPGTASGALPTTFPAAVKLGPLPQYSKTDYPQNVVIKGLMKVYGPSKMPHGLIVSRLEKLIRKSKLAQQFHGQTRMVCAGCHHHSPVGKRPAACGSCHGPKGHSTQDKPGLKAAYHRQCMACHKKMGLGRLNKCTSCHKPASGAAPGATRGNTK